MTHVVDSIAERFLDLLTDTTDAQDRVYRDLSQSERFQARDDLPAIDIRIGAEEEHPRPTAGKYRAVLTIHVNLFCAECEGASSAVMRLRAQVDRTIMQATTWPTGMSEVPRRMLATAVSPNTEGSIRLAAIGLMFRVVYEHNYFDPESQ